MTEVDWNAHWAGPTPRHVLLQGETVARAYWAPGHSRPTTASLLQGDTVAKGLLARSQQAHHSHVCYRERRSTGPTGSGHSRPTTAPSVQGETVAKGLCARSQQAHPHGDTGRTEPYWVGHSRHHAIGSVTGRHGRHGPTGAWSQQAHHSHVCTGRHGRTGPTGSVTAGPPSPSVTGVRGRPGPTARSSGPPQPVCYREDTVATAPTGSGTAGHNSHVCYRETRSPGLLFGHSRHNPQPRRVKGRRDGRPGLWPVTAGPPRHVLLQGDRSPWAYARSQQANHSPVCYRGETVAQGPTGRSQQRPTTSPVCYRERRARGYWLGHSRPTTATSVTGDETSPRPTGSVTAWPTHSPVCYREETVGPGSLWLGTSRPPHSTSVTRGERGQVAQGLMGRSQQAHHSPRLLQGEDGRQGPTGSVTAGHHPQPVCYRERTVARGR
ncbi:unnamed protein product [Arctogadus glacialis]